MLFFAFFLLIGSSPTFGQTCPTTGGTDSVQTFCFLATVGDIQRDGTDTAVYQTADNVNDTEAIPSSELLSDNTTYYVGGQSVTCTRVSVTVDITAEDYPNNTLFPGENSFTISPCSSTFTAGELATYFTAIADYEIMVYDDEFGMTEATGPLTPNESYFVGQVSTDGDASPTPVENNCPSLRVAVGYDPQPTPPPTAETPQTFCDGATVGDLVAQGTSPNSQSIRWYRSETSFQPLPNSTLLINDATYYATQVINDRNNPLPPCESETRTPVKVTVQQPVDLGTPTEGIICESDVSETFPSIDEIRKYYLALLPEGTPTNGTLNPTAAQLAQEYQNDADGLGSFMTVYTVGVDGCESSVELTATIVAEEEANAGTIEDIVVECEDDTVVILDDSLLSEDATTGGTFTGEGVNEDGNFDPAIGPGTYPITYSVDDNADCVIEGTSDSTTFNITVQGSELGEPIVLEMCITEAQDAIETPADFEAFFNNILAENGITDFTGAFDPDENVVGTAIFAYINSEPTAPETFNTTYTVSTDCGEESVDITLTINNAEEPNAGEINAAPVCSSATPFNLYSLLGEGNDTGGIFYNENEEVIEDGLFDVSETGNFPITYTVTENVENCTAGEDDSTTFTLTVNEGIVAESPEAAIVCESDVDALFPSNDEIRKFYIAIAQRAGFPTNGTLSPNAAQLAQNYQNDEDGLGDFTTTYTFGEGDCQTSVELTATIIPVEDANAGIIEDVTVECDNEEVIVLASLPNEGGNTGGTFSGEGVENGNFDPAVGPGTYTITYTVDETAVCVTPGTSDETTFTITVQSTFDLGAPIVMEMCITEVEEMLANPQLAIDLFNDAVAERTNGDLSGEFTPSIATIAGQIAAYLNDPTPSQIFETTYSVSTNCGDDSVLISLTINDVSEPTTGEIEDFQVCVADSTINLFDRLNDDNTQGGTFSNEDGEIVDGLFNISQIGEYTITYTVSEDDEDSCVEGTASTQFTITVTDEITLENPAPAIICESDVDSTFPSIDEIRKFYIALIPAGVPTNGTLNPTAAQLAQIYQNDEDGLGDFTTTYTVTSGDCATTVELTARIVAEEEATVDPIEDDSVCISEDGLDLSAYVSDNTMGGTFTSNNGTITGNTLDVSEEGVFTIIYTVSEDDSTTCLTGTASTEFTVTVSESTFDAGDDNSIEVCNDDVRNLNNTGVRNLFLGLLDADVSTNGTFEPTISQLINQYNIVSNYGDFTTTYTLGEGDCADSVVLTVTVIEANDAGADMNLTFCETEGPVNLFDFLSPYATTNGTFEGLTDGMFDPSNAELGETVIIYEVEDDESVCSTGNFTATFTINVVAPAPANAGDNQTPDAYCVTDDQDKALIPLLGDGANPFGTFTIDGEEITSFNPAELGVGEFVITYSLDENDCAIGTDSATITITVVEQPDAPVADANQSFCLINNPTVADIVATGENVKIYLDEALNDEATGTNPLADETVYYAAATTNGCKSEGVMINIILTNGTVPTLQTDGDEFCRSDNPTVQDLINNLSGSGIKIYQASTGGTALATSTALVDGTTYFASGTDAVGCESSERRPLQVEVAFCGIPEAFSPNEDNINDRFVIPDIATDFPNYTIEIFNRWGNVVFKGNSSTGDWDGVSNQSATLGDNILSAGVYFYILNYNDGQTAPVQGKVYLSR